MVQPEEEKALDRPYGSLPVRGFMRNMGTDFLVGSAVPGQEVTVLI